MLDRRPTTVPRFLSVDEVAALLKVSRSKVYVLVKSGKLASYRIGDNGDAIRISQDDLLEFIAGCRVENQNGARRPRRERTKLKHLKV